MSTDAHAHIGDYSPVIPGGMHTADDLVARWDAVGIECGMISVLLPDKRAANEMVRRACERHPGRIFGYIHVNPVDVSGSLAELERCTGSDCFRGVKYHPQNDVYYPFIEALFPVYERVEQLGLPALWHTGTYPYSHPLQVAYVARQFPASPHIMAHFALADLTWECFPAAALADNVLADMTANPIIPVLNQWIERFGAGRMLWGSDFPFYDVAYEHVKLDHLSLSAEQRESIASGNARRLFGIG
jgi:predicted TIM-barrel fold metal-dependent hydrolase